MFFCLRIPTGRIIFVNGIVPTVAPVAVPNPVPTPPVSMVGEDPNTKAYS